MLKFFLMFWVCFTSVIPETRWVLNLFDSSWRKGRNQIDHARWGERSSCCKSSLCFAFLHDKEQNLHLCWALCPFATFTSSDLPKSSWPGCGRGEDSAQTIPFILKPQSHTWVCHVKWHNAEHPFPACLCNVNADPSLPSHVISQFPPQAKIPWWIWTPDHFKNVSFSCLHWPSATWGCIFNIQKYTTDLLQVKMFTTNIPVRTEVVRN